MKQFNLLITLALLVVMTFMLSSCEEEKVADLTTPILETVEETDTPALQSLFALPDEAKRWSEEQLKEYIRGVHNQEIAVPKNSMIPNAGDCLTELFSHPAAPLRIINGNTLYIIVTDESLAFSIDFIGQTSCSYDMRYSVGVFNYY